MHSLRVRALFLRSYSLAVLRDVQKTCHIHFQAMAELVQDGKLVNDALQETTAPEEPHPLWQQGALLNYPVSQPLPPLQLDQTTMYYN